MKRTIALGAAWTASAAAAVGLGFLAVSLVDASASPGTTDRAAATTTVSPATGTATPTASPAPPAAAGEHVTVGGTVFASCAGGVPSLAGAPAPGWWVDDSNDPGEVQFENGTSKVEVHTVCVGDVPQFSDEGLRADDSGRGSGSPASSSGSSSSTSGRDDSEDDSSGHGSDDPPGDDSSGRDGGGHGSDG